MACTLCNCPDHLNRPCDMCLNCVGHLDEPADYDQDHTDYTVEPTDDHENVTVVTAKPRYKYNAKTGQVREVSDIVGEARGS